jgi:hypothetical protein
MVIGNDIIFYVHGAWSTSNTMHLLQKERFATIRPKQPPRKAKRMVLQCINGVGSNPVEGRTKI